MDTAKSIQASGLTNAQLAEKLGVNHSTVWRWRMGKEMPGAGMVVPLAAALGVPRRHIRPDWAAVFDDE